MAISNQQYDQIMKSYTERQLKNNQLLNSRILEVYSKVPEYETVCQEMSAFAAASVKKRLLGDHVDSVAFDAYIDSCTSKKQSLLTSNGFPANYLEPIYDCPDCKDTGYIGNVKCHCFKEEQARILYESSNLRSILSDCGFDRICFDYYQNDDLTHYRKAVEDCHHFVDNFDSSYENLLFYGNVGTGKSFLSGCIAKELISNNHSVLYYSASELFRIMSNILFNKSDYSISADEEDALYTSDLLIIDDLGTELTNSAVATELFSLLNERHLNMKSTIISTNLEFKELQDRYADRIFSRLLERYSFKKLTGPDIRRIKKR